MKSIISSSILSVNFVYLINDIEMINDSEAGWVHVDTVGSAFVFNISFGFPVLKYVTKPAEKPPDVHLMIVQSEKFIPGVKALGVRIMNVHYEACPHLHRVVQQIRKAEMLPVVTTNPATPVAMLRDIINDVYMALVMSVNPGFGDQKSIEYTIDKICELRELITVTGLEALIEADGGVNLETDTRLAAAGADVLVAGNAIFSVPGLVEAIHALRNL